MRNMLIAPALKATTDRAALMLSLGWNPFGESEHNDRRGAVIALTFGHLRKAPWFSQHTTQRSVPAAYQRLDNLTLLEDLLRHLDGAAADGAAAVPQPHDLARAAPAEAVVAARLQSDAARGIEAHDAQGRFAVD